MQIPQRGLLAEPTATRSQYSPFYQGRNQIGGEGCRYLKESHWPNLRQLNLGLLNSIQGATRSTARDAGT